MRTRTSFGRRRRKRQVMWLPSLDGYGHDSSGNSLIMSTPEPTNGGVSNQTEISRALVQATSSIVAQTNPSSSGAANAAGMFNAIPDLRIERIVGRLPVFFHPKTDTRSITSKALDVLKISVGLAVQPVESDGSTLQLGDYGLKSMMQETNRAFGRFFWFESCFVPMSFLSSVTSAPDTALNVETLSGEATGKPNLFYLDIKPRVTVRKGSALMLYLTCCNMSTTTATVTNPWDVFMIDDLRLLVSRSGRF